MVGIRKDEQFIHQSSESPKIPHNRTQNVQQYKTHITRTQKKPLKMLRFQTIFFLPSVFVISSAGFSYLPPSQHSENFFRLPS